MPDDQPERQVDDQHADRRHDADDERHGELAAEVATDRGAQPAG